jgi:uncharacterized protein (TIGR02231 family)
MNHVPVKISHVFGVFSIALGIAATHAAEPIAAKSQITDVTAYADRAQIRRTAEVQLAAGENRVVFSELPVALQDDSVRASGSARAPMTIQDVAVRRFVYEQLRDEALAELETSLQKLRDERDALDARLRLIDQQRQFLQQIQVKANTDISRDIQINKLDMAQLRELNAFWSGELTKLDEEYRKIGIARREMEPKIRAAESEFNKRRAAATRSDKTVTVTVNAKEATKAKVQISYVLGGASWTAAYDARTDASTNIVEWTYNAFVRQNTGEDWGNVNLALSTARPAIGARMPDLGKWTLKFMEEMPKPAAAPTAALRNRAELVGRIGGLRLGDEELATDKLQSTAEIAAVPQEAVVEQAGPSVTFRVPHAAEVPGDGEPHRQTVAIHKLAGEFSYAATPKLSPYAYLKTTLTNLTDAPFLGGQVNVFVGNDFIGKSWIGTVPQGAKFDLFLGIDEGIRVKREELKDKRSKSGIFNKKKRQVFAYKITVENYKDKPHVIVVYDHIPVAANDEIKVSLGETMPKPTEFDEANGKMSWEITLNPREKREIWYEFSVEWPQDKQISGL